LGDKEQVVGGIGGAEFLVNMGGIAIGGGSFSSLGVEALDGSSSRKDTLAFVTNHMDEKPGNGIGIRGRGVGNSLAGYAAAVTGHPGGPSEMFAEGFAVGVVEVGVGSFQDPSEIRAIGLAGVDLIALGMERKEESLSGRRLKLRRDLLRGGGKGEQSSKEKNREEN